MCSLREVRHSLLSSNILSVFDDEECASLHALYRSKNSDFLYW